MAPASATAGRGRWEGRLALLHDAKSAADDSPHGFAGFGMLGERLVGHALLEFENPWLA